MNIVRYRPFREFGVLQNEMNRLFADFSPRAVNDEETISGNWNPKVNIFENKEHLILEAELPGLTRDDFDLTIEDNVLTLKGERTFEKKTDDENYHRVERSYGSFLRSFTLPQTVSTDSADATFENGMLRVAIPKREETKARKIEVKTADGSPKTIEAKPASA